MPEINSAKPTVSSAKPDVTSTPDVTQEVNFIWSIANKLRGPYQSDKYKDVIIPMVIIRRFECALEKTKDTVVAQFKKMPNYPAKAMYKLSGHQFYNTSEFNLARLLNDSDHIADNFKSYINGFSANIQDILESLDFGKQIDKMDSNDRLFTIVKAFSEIDLHPETVDNIKMGYIFEELIRKFSENAEAGDHYTGRDIIKTMVSLVLSEGCDDVFEDGKIITVLDQAAGTGGMLSTAADYIHKFNPTADVRLFSQEINPESYAMCLAEMLIRGQNAENIRFQDTMKEDCFPDTKMRFVLENPPFGTAWGGKDAYTGVEEAVLNEAAKGDAGRFPAGTPASSDMQLLFIQSALNKLDPKNGRAAIIENGSPLFSGGTSSGESQIRRYLLENDYIEAIIQLKTDMFYNTGIATYIWVLSMNKREERRGKVQLIDASHLAHPLRKSLGNKRFEITEEDRNEITRLYSNFEENEYCKIFANPDFIYREYVVMQPLQRNYAITEERIETMLANGTLNTLYDPNKVEELESADKLTGKDQTKLNKFYENKPTYDAIVRELNEHISDDLYKSPSEFRVQLNQTLAKATSDKKLIEKVMVGLSEMDKTAEIHTDKKGIVYDKDTKDIEIVPIDIDIDDYMEKEVLPYVPDAKVFFEEDLSKKKPVIKTGAEIPFTKYFYKYNSAKPASELASQFLELEQRVSKQIEELFNLDSSMMKRDGE